MRMPTVVRLVAVLRVLGLALLTHLSGTQAAEESGGPERTDRGGDALPPDAIARLEMIPLEYASAVNAVCFCSDGKRVISGSQDGTLALWDVETGKRIHTLEGHPVRVHSLCFSPGGRRLVSVSDKTLLVWQPFLDEMKGAQEWARETRLLPEQENNCPFLAPLADPLVRFKLLDLIQHYAAPYFCKFAALNIMGNHWHGVCHFDQPRTLSPAERMERALALYPNSRKTLEAWPEKKWLRLEKRLFDSEEVIRRERARGFKKRGVLRKSCAVSQTDWSWGANSTCASS